MSVICKLVEKVDYLFIMLWLTSTVVSDLLHS